MLRIDKKAYGHRTFDNSSSFFNLCSYDSESYSSENCFTGTLNTLITILSGLSLFLLSCNYTTKDTIPEKIKGEWIEIRRTNTHNSSFNKHFGTFYTPSWHLTITDSNYILLKINGNPKTNQYPYRVFYDSILVMENQFYNDLFQIKKVDSQSLVLSKLPNKRDAFPWDTILYHFVSEKYYRHLSLQQKKALSFPTIEDTLYVRSLIHRIIPPETDESGDWRWGTRYLNIFVPETHAIPLTWSKNIRIHLDTSLSGISDDIYDITVYNTGHDISLGYDGIEIDTSGKIYTSGYVDKLHLMSHLFNKYVLNHIFWRPATTLGFRHVSDIDANIHYKK